MQFIAQCFFFSLPFLPLHFCYSASVWHIRIWKYLSAPVWCENHIFISLTDDALYDQEGPTAFVSATTLPMKQIPNQLEQNYPTSK